MCDIPNNIDAVHHPANSLFDARASKFCSSPRNNNSSGHAVNTNIPTDPTSISLHRPICGSKAMNFICIPSGIATHPNATKLPTTYSPQLFPQRIEYPTPFARRTSKNVASATSTAISTVNTYASRPPGYGHIQCVGPNFTNTHTPATDKKSCQLPIAALADEAASPSGTNTNAAIAPAR